MRLAEERPEESPPHASASGPDGPSRLARAAHVGALALRHRQLIVETLELLREARTLTPEQEARALAAYEQGSAAVKARLSELLEDLQRADLGEVVVALREERDAWTGDASAFAHEGRRLVGEYKAEFQAFLDRNRPTVEAVQRASALLAEAAKELAASLRVAGRDAADELLKRGRRALAGVETEELERTVLDWSLRTLPEVEARLRRLLYSLSALFLSMALLVVSLEYPPVRPFAVAVATASSLWTAFLFLRWGLALGAYVREQHGTIESLAAMPSRDRRDWLLERWRRRTGAASAGPGVSAQPSERRPPQPDPTGDAASVPAGLRESPRT